MVFVVFVVFVVCGGGAEEDTVRTCATVCATVFVNVCANKHCLQCAFVCVCGRARVCVWVCGRVCVRTRVCARACVWACIWARAHLFRAAALLSRVDF